MFLNKHLKPSGFFFFLFAGFLVFVFAGVRSMEGRGGRGKGEVEGKRKMKLLLKDEAANSRECLCIFFP